MIVTCRHQVDAMYLYDVTIFIGKWILINEQEKHALFSHKIHSLNHSSTNAKSVTLV